MTENRDKTWFQNRVVAYAVGLLSPEDVARMDELCAANPAWREEIIMLTEERRDRDPESIGHVPDSLLARWEKARGSLPPVEWRLVESHVVRCERCRRKLDQLGVSVAPSTARRAGIRGMRLAVGLAAVLVAAFGLRVWMSPGIAEFRYTMLRSMSEEMARSVNTITLETGARQLAIYVPSADELGWSPDAIVSIAIRKEAITLFEKQGQLREFSAPARLVLRTHDVLEPGRYEIIFESDRGNSRTLEFWIETG